MTIFKLDRFPDVCRLCLRDVDKSEQTVSVDSKDPAFDGTVLDFIGVITFVISENKSHLLPQKVCLKCMESLKSFATYRSKLMTLHLLMNSLVELKRSNSIPIMDLFQSNREAVTDLLKDLDICDKDANVEVQQLLKEFPCYNIAKIADPGFSPVSLEVPQTSLEEDDSFNPDMFLNDEFCSTKSPVGTHLIDEDKICSDQTDNRSETDCSEIDGLPVGKSDGSAGTKLKERLKCNKCKYSTLYLQSYLSHQQKHRKIETRRFHCIEPGCTESYKVYAEYQNHCVSVHALYICETCGLRCSTQAALDVHKGRHLAEYSYSCTYCKKRCKSSAELRNHVRFWHEAATSFPCDTCSMTFKRKDIRDTHQLSHRNEYNFPCNLCDKKFKDASGLRRHRIEVHDKVRHSCDHCGHVCLTRSKLRDHIEGIHGIQTRFVCEICIFTTDGEEKLEAHRTRHANPNELECGTCLKLFNSKEMITNHLCITYRDDYICCNRDFRNHYQYNKHMLTKHNITVNARVKPIPGVLLGQLKAKRKRVECCPKCDAAFPNKRLKLQHMETCKSAP